MIRTLLLIFDPGNTWEKIEQDHHGVGRVFLQFFLPVFILGLAGEAFLIHYFGHFRGTINPRIEKVPQELLTQYIAFQALLGLVLLFLGAWIIRKIGQGFHRRHSYQECFATLAYSLLPYYLVRILDGIPIIPSWACYAVGASLAVSTLYRGVARIMKPDPSNALGVFLTCSLLLLFLTAILHFFSMLVLEQKIIIPLRLASGVFSGSATLL